MAGSDLVNKFTNDQYLTRKEIAQALGTNLIDQIWRENLLYRREKSVELPIVDNAKFHFTLTQTQKVISMYGEISERINTCINAFEKLSAGKIAKYTLTHDMIKNALRCIAKINNLDVSEITLQNIMEHQLFDESYKNVINYYNALEELLKSPYEGFNDVSLGKYLSILKGQEELTSFYRMLDKNPASARYLIGAEFDNGVQFNLIESMMNDLINFANDNGQPILIRLIGTIFMINYIKPFEELNFEISMLMAKLILANSGLLSAAVYVPIESILLSKELFDDLSREIQRSHDFTYMFLRGGEIIKTSFNTIIDRIIQVNAKALENVVNAGDDAKKFKEEFGFVPEKPIFDKPEPKPASAPVIKPVANPEPKPAPVQALVINSSPAHAFSQVVQPTRKVELKVTSDISEKELKALEREILESDPYIKKGQAHFYVRHCTKGKFYTIQDYKKCEGCVYETARTSMDNLAYRGFYRREQIKNKFVYTPIDK